MKYTWSLILCALLVPSFLTAQELKLKSRISDAAYKEDALSPKKLLPTSESSLVVLYSNEGDGDASVLKYRMDLYSTDKLELVRSLEPVRKAPAGLAAIETALVFSGKSVLFGTQRRPAEKQLKVLWQQFDPRLARNNAPFLDLITFDLEKAFVPGDNAAPVGLETSVSPDGSKLLLFVGGIPLANAGTGHAFVVIDKDMQVLWQHVVISDPDVEMSTLLSAAVDDNGTCTAWVSNTLRKEASKDGVLNVSTKVLRMSAEGVVEGMFKMKDNYWPVGARLMVLDSGVVACAGVYGALVAKKEIRPGTFYAYLAKGEYEFKQQATTKFPVSGKPGGMPYENMRVADLLRGDKGGTFLVCEVGDRQDAVVTSTFGRNKNVTERIHGDIVAQAFTESGSSAWITVIPRNTKTISHLLGRTQSLVFAGRLSIFTLDDEGNIAKRLKGEELEVVPTEGTRVLHHAFDSKGGYVSNAILASGKDVDFLVGTEMVPSALGVFYSFGQRILGKGKVVPIKLEFTLDQK